MGSQLDPLPLSRVGSRELLPSPNFSQLHFGEPSSRFTPGLGSALDTYEVFLSTEIVEVIIGDLFFRDNEQLEDIDDDEQNPADAAHKKLVKKQNEKKNAMKLFCKKDDALV